VSTPNKDPVIPGEFLLYETDDGRTRVECRFVTENLWLPQSGLAELVAADRKLTI
jgi:hypothetical protein